MSSVNSVTKEVQFFQAQVKKLRADVKEASINWNDEKNRALSNMLSKIAGNTKSVMQAAEQLVSDCRRFESVAGE